MKLNIQLFGGRGSKIAIKNKYLHVPEITLEKAEIKKYKILKKTKVGDETIYHVDKDGYEGKFKKIYDIDEKFYKKFNKLSTYEEKRKMVLDTMSPEEKKAYITRERQAKSKKHLDDKKERAITSFFGEHRKVSNKYFEFKRIIDKDNFIIVTKNVKIIKGNPVLLTDNNKGVYLKDFQIREISNYYEGINTYAVKLNRKYFKEYTFKNDFEDFSFSKRETFDSLKKAAKEQEKVNLSFKEGWINGY